MPAKPSGDADLERLGRRRFSRNLWGNSDCGIRWNKLVHHGGSTRHGLDHARIVYKWLVKFIRSQLPDFGQYDQNTRNSGGRNRQHLRIHAEYWVAASSGRIWDGSGHFRQLLVNSGHKYERDGCPCYESRGISRRHSGIHR